MPGNNIGRYNPIQHFLDFKLAVSKPKLIFVSVAAVLFIFFVAVWLAGNTLSSPAYQAVGDLPPDLAGRPVEFLSESGTTVHGWFVPGRKGAGAIALMHGIRANRLSMLDRARFLSHEGYSVLVFDFQAHGESGGEHITFGYLESRDARAAIECLRMNAGGEKIGVIGVSMGALLSCWPHRRLL